MTVTAFEVETTTNGSPRRGWMAGTIGALRGGIATLRSDLAAERTALRHRRALRRVDGRLLRDLGYDRGAC